MFKTLVNEVRFRFPIVVAGPLVIRAGKSTGLDPTRPDMEFVRDGTGQVFIPGSSLKGVIRSRAERILRSHDPSWACDPFRHACGVEARKGPHDGEGRYRRLCHACRMFGSVALRGRAAFADARLQNPDEVVLGERHHVGIDRVTGGPARAVLFRPETVEQGTFAAEVVLTNFALWQVLLLVAVLQDLDEGFVGLGGATTRGYGRVRIPAEEWQVRWRDTRPEPPETLRGYREQDRAPAPIPGAFQRGIYGWEAVFTGKESLMAALKGLDLPTAVRQDFPREVSRR